MILQLLFLSAALMHAEALECYTCVNCEDVSKAETVTCPQDKNCVAMNLYLNSLITIYRGCEEASDCEVLEHITRSECQICDTDFCNSRPLTLITTEDENVFFQRLEGIFERDESDTFDDRKVRHRREIDPEIIRSGKSGELSEWSSGKSSEVSSGKSSEVSSGKSDEVSSGKSSEISSGKSSEVSSGKSKEVSSGKTEEGNDSDKDWDSEEVLSDTELQEMFEAFQTVFEDIDIAKLGFGF